MNQRIRKVTFNNAGDRDELTTVGVCKKVIVKEDPSNANWPTTEWDFGDAASGGNEIRKSFGESHVFEKQNNSGSRNTPLFSPGERIAFIETVTVASADFQVVEEW